MKKGKLEITVSGLAGDLLMLPRSEQIVRKDFTICYKHLVDRSVHMFIASQQWEELVINAHPSIDHSYIALVATKASKITLKLECEVNENIIELICKIMPDKSGTVRRYFLLGKDIRPVINI